MDIVVCGGSVIGLASAMLLARDGHRVTVLEGDEQGPPDPRAAWDAWERKGVAQFRQPHNLFPRLQRVLDDELPEISERLVDAGCLWQNDPFLPPPFLDQSPRPGDERFRFLTGRRPTVEACFAQAALDTDGVTVRRGVRLLDYVMDGSRVVGVMTSKGPLHADLVVDAMGRQSPTVGLLSTRGFPPYQESQDVGFAYYTRYFRGPERPPVMGPGLTPIGSFSLLTLYGDNDTWSVTAFIASEDRALTAFRRADVWERVVRACPLHAHWLQGEPITDVLPMAGVLDRYRRFVLDGRPQVTGLLAVGDAWACTNPSAGRGLSVGMVHAQQLRRVVAKHAHDLTELALAFDAATEEQVTPFFRNQASADATRITEMRACREGRPVPEPEPQWAALAAAAMKDADCFRAMIDVIYCLAFPEEVYARPEVAAQLAALGSPGPAPLRGPDRGELLALIGEA